MLEVDTLAKTRIDKLIDQAEQTNAQIRALTEILLLSGRLAQTIPAPIPAKLALGAVPKVQEVQSEIYFDTVRGIVQGIEDAPMNFQQNVIDPIQRNIPSPLAPAKKVRSKAQKANDKLQSQAFKNANSALRKTNGQMRKGVNQRDIAARAQRELRKLKNGKKPAKKGRVANRKPSKRSSRK